MGAPPATLKPLRPRGSPAAGRPALSPPQPICSESGADRTSSRRVEPRRHSGRPAFTQVGTRRLCLLWGRASTSQRDTEGDRGRMRCSRLAGKGAGPGNSAGQCPLQGHSSLGRILHTKHVKLAARGPDASFLWPVLASEFDVLGAHCDGKVRMAAGTGKASGTRGACETHEQQPLRATNLERRILPPAPLQRAPPVRSLVGPEI